MTGILYILVIRFIGDTAKLAILLNFDATTNLKATFIFLLLATFITEGATLSKSILKGALSIRVSPDAIGGTSLSILTSFSALGKVVAETFTFFLLAKIPFLILFIAMWTLGCIFFVKMRRRMIALEESPEAAWDVSNTMHTPSS
jgi:hypothetical protein